MFLTWQCRNQTMTFDTDLDGTIDFVQPAAVELPRTLRVLLIADGTVSTVLNKEMTGCAVAARAATPDHALELAAKRVADVVVLVVPFDHDDVDFCHRLQGVASLPVILVSNSVDPRLIEKALDLGICGYLPDIANTGALFAAVMLGARWFTSRTQLYTHAKRLWEQNRQLAQTLHDRKLIERAKGVYMRVLGLQEAEAHRRLQQESQKRRLALVDLARKIIESDELLGR
jgi:response regulator NasT